MWTWNEGLGILMAEVLTGHLIPTMAVRMPVRCVESGWLAQGYAQVGRAALGRARTTASTSAFPVTHVTSDAAKHVLLKHGYSCRARRPLRVH